MKNVIKTVLLLSLLCSFFASCKKDKEDETPSGGDKPTIASLAAAPNSSVSYGDVVALTGSFSDEKGLQSYTIIISNAQGELYNNTQMLTGKTFSLNASLVIPLPKNAQAGNVTISVTLKNSGNGTATEEVSLAGVQVPDFEKLYLSIGSKIHEMEKDGDVYAVEDLFAANAVGKIYTNAAKTGMFWGATSGTITALASGDIAIGKASESYLRVSFNPVTFALEVAEAEKWDEIEETYYIYGNISGNWKDADRELKDEVPSGKMTGYQSGNKKYWTWTPPGLDASDPKSGEPGYDMWGNIAPGSFRFKKAGSEEYVIFKDNQITTGTTNDKAASFITTADGHITIKLFWDGTKFDKVSLEAEDRSLDFMADGSLNINGAPAPVSITFAGTALTLKPGTLYTYEGTASLTKDQTLSAVNANLSMINPDPDVFSGKGNASWKMTGSSGDWLIRVDPFGYTIYACKQTGYPDVIYMDGWGWAKFAENPSKNWDPSTFLCLQRTNSTSHIYEATFYNFGWGDGLHGSDVSFWAAPTSDTDFGKKIILSKYFEGVAPAVNGMYIPLLSASYMKVRVDLKDGFEFDTNQTEGESNQFYKLVPTNNKKFTATFTPQ